MRDEEKRHSPLAEPVHALRALSLELHVPDGEHLVEKENVRLDVRGDGEAEPCHHPRRVGTQRRVDELLDAGELDDLRQPARHVAVRMAEDGTV